MKWFKHDANATLDSKLRRLRKKYGMQGYGLYWYCLECVARNVEKHNLSFELEEDAELISLDTDISRELVEEMMRDMVEWGLFEESGGIITCLKMAERTDEYTQKVIKNLANVPTVSRHSPDSVRLNRREEKRIEEKRPKKPARNTIPPTLEMVAQYCKERGNSINPEKFFSHYEINGWVRGKTKIKDWQAAVRYWEQTEKDNLPSAKQSARPVF